MGMAIWNERTRTTQFDQPWSLVVSVISFTTGTPLTQSNILDSFSFMQTPLILRVKHTISKLVIDLSWKGSNMSKNAKEVPYSANLIQSSLYKCSPPHLKRVFQTLLEDTPVSLFFLFCGRPPNPMVYASWYPTECSTLGWSNGV